MGSTNNAVSPIPFDRTKNLNRGGRPKGSTNLAKRNAREAIKLLVEKNVPKVQKWLDSIEKEQGAQAAYRCFIDLVEYAVPKMSRNELTADQPTAISISWGTATEPTGAQGGHDGESSLREAQP
jgi:hypothetical protein